MKKGSHRATFAWAVLLLAGAASAAEHLPAAAKPDAPGGAEVGANPLSVTLESKLRLVKLQLAQSPAAQRIRQSNNAPAKRKLADAQAHYAKAQAESNAGRPEVATQLLDESLRQIVSASSLVPDVAQQAAQERSRNASLREAIKTFQTLHKSLTNRMATNKVQTSNVAVDTGQIDGMMGKADALVASGDQHEANAVLIAAYKIVVSTLNKMLAAQTFVYDLKFDSPAEEFRHELARNLSYEELIPIALAQLNSTRETATLTERRAQRSRDLRNAAQKQADGGNFSAATKTIQEATSHLQASLRIAGVVVPQSPENMP